MLRARNRMRGGTDLLVVVHHVRVSPLLTSCRPSSASLAGLRACPRRRPLSFASSMLRAGRCTCLLVRSEAVFYCCRATRSVSARARSVSAWYTAATDASCAAFVVRISSTCCLNWGSYALPMSLTTLFITVSMDVLMMSTTCWCWTVDRPTPSVELEDLWDIAGVVVVEKVVAHVLLQKGCPSRAGNSH